MPTSVRTKAAIPVYLEAGQKKVFACALDWPGWCRRGSSEQHALEALADYAGRYALVVERAGLHFTPHAPVFDVVERIPATPGATSTNVDFGALGDAAEQDSRPLSPADAQRLAVILEASWATLDGMVAASPPSLTKGPRGGGRDRDAVFAHVVEAEAAYARKIGVRIKAPASGDPEAVAQLRTAIATAVRAARSGAIEGGWLPRYAARRIAWHVLDHAWEIQDRSG